MSRLNEKNRTKSATNIYEDLDPNPLTTTDCSADARGGRSYSLAETAPPEPCVSSLQPSHCRGIEDYEPKTDAVVPVPNTTLFSIGEKHGEGGKFSQYFGVREQVRGIGLIVKRWIPDAIFRILPAVQLDAEGIAVEKEEEKRAWDNILDQYKHNKLPQRRMHTVLGRTPKILQKCGAPNLPIKISTGVIRKITRKHKIPLEELQKLPTEIGDPLAVFESCTVENSIVVLTEILGEGQNAVVTIRLNTKESEGHKINAVSSTHGRPPRQIENFIKGGRTLYINTKKYRAYLRSGELQLPTEASKRGRVLTEEDIREDVIRGTGVNRNFRKKFHQVHWIKQGNEVFGWFNPAKNEIVLHEECSISTAMEAFWHATFHLATTAAPRLRNKMLKFAEGATENTKYDIKKFYPELKAGSKAWLDKLGAMRFVADYANKIEELLNDPKEDVEVSPGFSEKGDLRRLGLLPREEAIAALARAFVRGKHRT